jgi:hypothetical protein
MPKVRTSAGIAKGSQGAKSVNPLYAAARGVARYVGGAAREIRDIPTAIGTSIREKSPLETARQVQEAAAAVTAGEKGTTPVTIDAFGKYKQGNNKRK